MVGVTNRCDTAVTPLSFNLFRTSAIKGEKPGSVVLAIVVQALQKVLDRGVFGLIANHDDRIPFE